MKRLLAILLGFVVGCSDGVEPESGTPTPFSGTYALTAIDDAPLPVEVMMDDEPTVVFGGELSFTPPNVVSINLTLGEPGGTATRSIAVAGFYRLAGPDSAVFPILPAPEVYLRRNGPTIIVVTRAEGNAVGPARLLGGSHRFRFAGG